MRNILRLSIFLFCMPLWQMDLCAQVAATIDYARQADDSIALIHIRWSAADEDAWHERNEGMLDIMSLRTDITSDHLPTSDIGRSYYQFEFAGFCAVEMLLSNAVFSPDENLYLWDTKSNTVIFDLTVQRKQRLLTPSFDPGTTMLVWRYPAGKKPVSRFILQNIYYQQLSPSRVLDIGFGTAFACHPNAACKEDSILQLISNSAVRIRLVMEEGIGWCTGSFVNNARNDKTPYLLTAYHCTFSFTPLYDMWRFDFEYKSDTCPNPPAEPVYFSLTGCELISSGQASDFLLVRLDQDIPLNQEVTFAGWDRDLATIPDTSYLIHHPNADIRKISTSVNDAVIHPNQIGWSEGYTTPANHHFRLKFTEGGHEPGSSGGPLFNEDGHLVGQLHGGTAGCEATNSAFAGRLARSWDLGPTPQERLKDWLDPDQTGLVQIPSIENIGSNDVVDVQGLVVDPQGRSVKNAVIKITGSVEETVTTDEDGVFLLTGYNRNGQYTITPEKNENPVNGINALDVLAIQKHLLVKDTFDFPWQHIAADATNNNEISVGDILVILRLLLGKIQNFPSSPSWKFDPPAVIFDPIPQGNTVVQFTAIKIGDVNGTADPSQ
jgi:lysyl endopeptidase